jgi:hypothetical protein
MCGLVGIAELGIFGIVLSIYVIALVKDTGN